MVKNQSDKRRIIMARHGENIRKRKDGRWEGRFPVYDEEKGKKVYHSIYAQTYEEVRRRLAAQKSPLADAALGTEGSIDSYNIRISVTAERWLEEIKRNRKSSTYIKYSAVYSNHIKPALGQVVLSEITDMLVDEKISDHLSDSVHKSIYCVLNQILKFASKKYSLTIPMLKKKQLPSVVTRQSEHLHRLSRKS